MVTSAQQQNHIRDNELDNRYFSYDGKWKYYSDEKWHYTNEPKLTEHMEKARINSQLNN